MKGSPAQEASAGLMEPRHSHSPPWLTLEEITLKQGKGNGSDFTKRKKGGCPLKMFSSRFLVFGFLMEQARMFGGRCEGRPVTSLGWYSPSQPQLCCYSKGAGSQDRLCPQASNPTHSRLPHTSCFSFCSCRPGPPPRAPFVLSSSCLHDDNAG